MQRKALLLVLLIFIFSVCIGSPAMAKPYMKDSSHLKMDGKGTTFTIKVNSGKEKVTWTSTKTKVCTVNKKGVVTAVGNGRGCVIAKYGKKKKTVWVEVVYNPGTTYMVKHVQDPGNEIRRFPVGCEGISLYMALKAKGYIKNYSLARFMKTIPISPNGNPELGFAGDPSKPYSAPINRGKRTSINPKPLAKWGARFGKVESMEGCKPYEIRQELRAGNPVIIWMQNGWGGGVWRRWPWGRAVVNNHALVVVGYNTYTGAYLIEDSNHSKGRYWVPKKRFEYCFNVRKYAVVVR